MVGLSLFGCEVNILSNVHIVHWKNLDLDFSVAKTASSGPPCRSKHCGPASDRNEPLAASLRLGPDCPKSGRRCIFVGQNIPRWDSIGITQLPPKAADQERRISGERSELRLVDFNKYTKLQVKQSFKQTDAFWRVFLPKNIKFFKTTFLT